MESNLEFYNFYVLFYLFWHSVISNSNRRAVSITISLSYKDELVTLLKNKIYFTSHFDTAANDIWYVFNHKSYNADLVIFDYCFI